MGTVVRDIVKMVLETVLNHVFCCEQLRAINDFAAPKDKLYCIFNCCRLVNRALQEEPDDGSGAKAMGADEFLPMLIYTLMQVRPPCHGFTKCCRSNLEIYWVVLFWCRRMSKIWFLISRSLRASTGLASSLFIL